MTHQLSPPEIGFVDPSRTEKSNGSSKIGANTHNAFKSEDALDSALTSNGYSAANVRKMTTNDKVYAVRLLNLG